MVHQRLDLLLAFGFALVVLAPSESVGQSRTSPEERIRLLNKRAMDHFVEVKFEAAVRDLKDALKVARDANITNGEALVQTYLNLGIVYGDGLNNREAAVRHFAAALRLEPNAELSPARATPTLEEMFQEARRGTAPVAQPPTDKGTFEHTPVREASIGRPLRLRAYAPQQGLKRVMLFHRPFGSYEFRVVQMKRSQKRPGWYFADVPAEAMRGRTLEYYIEAQDKAGERIDGHGFSVSPNLVELISEERQQPQAKAKGPSRSRFSIGVLIGTGLGVVSGGTTKSEHAQPQVRKTPSDPETAAVNIEPGGAFTPLHIAPELNYHIDENWQVGVLGRIQLLNFTNEGSTKISLLAEARAKRYFGKGDFRFYLAFGAGAGQMRHRIALGDYDGSSETDNNRVDTRVAGLATFGVGSGLCWMFSRHIGFVAELNGLIVIPYFAANLDLNTGLQVTF